MTLLIVLGMILLLVVGLGFIAGSVFLIIFDSAFSGKSSLGVVIPCIVIFGLGVLSLYYVFTHLSISIG